ncbi:MAG: M67 family metallopeptidase, partial [Leptolyngbyaceae bacterium]|nr:M67 family metallopeptidase [Leptolyngbyaceae bacterium]
MTLQLTGEQLNAIFEHAERAYPEECCGLLLGQTLSQNSTQSETNLSFDKTVVELWATQNDWDNEAEASMASLSSHASQHHLTKARRYWIDPRQMLEAQRYARDRQLDIIGIYHSHPDHSATPSECDRAAAWHQYSYMIVSVQHGKAKHVLSWTLDEDNQFQSEEIQTVFPVGV